MTSVVHLEDFAAPLPEPANPQDERLAAEYQRGLADGETRARDLVITELTDAIHAAIEALETGDALRQQIIGETLSAVTPVLQAIVVQLAVSADDRIVAAIMSELQRLGTGGKRPPAASPHRRGSPNRSPIRSMLHRLAGSRFCLARIPKSASRAGGSRSTPTN